MKKTLLTMTAAALTAALSLTACGNDSEPAVPAARLLTVTVTLPDGGADTRAIFEEDNDGGTFNGLKAKWEKGDQVSVGFGDSYVTFTQTGELSADGNTATFAGEPPSTSTVKDGGSYSLTYPVLPENGVRDFTKQDGTLASLSQLDDLWIFYTYKDGALVLAQTSSRHVAFLRLEQGLKVCDESVTDNSVSLKITGDMISILDHPNLENSKTATDAPIEVSSVKVSAGKLQEDVYISLGEVEFADDMKEISLTVTPQSGTAVTYKLTRTEKLEDGKLYTVAASTTLTAAE